MRSRTVLAVLVGLLSASGLGVGGALAVVDPGQAVPGPASATLSITPGGLLALNFTFTVPNGSSLRYAMDGNFSPLLDSLPLNDSSRSRILLELASLEAAPLVGGFFGNRDGTVSAGEVTLFQSLVHQLATGTSGALPTGTLSIASFARLTLDSAAPSTSTFQTVTFEDAVGADSSGAPIGVAIQSSYQFPISGTGHTLAFAIGGGNFSSPLVIPTAVATISFSTPPGTTITSVDGLTGVSTTSDMWGWGGSSTSGSYTLSTGSTISIHYQTSFPTGDLLLGGVATAVVAVAASILLLRRRRRRRTTPPAEPGPGAGSVGPSGSA